MDEQLKTKIEAFKKNGLSVYTVTISGIQYIYRGINRREFKTLQGQMTKAAEAIRLEHSKDEAKMNSELALLKEKSEEKLMIIGVISPELTELDIDVLPAGVIGRLADLITIGSGFTEVTEEPQQL